MARFQINSKIAIEQICLDSTPKSDGTQRRITLELAGWDSGTPPQITAGSEYFIRVSGVSHDAKSRKSRFSIEAVKDATGVAYVFDRTSEKDTLLRVSVGKVTNHGGFKHDLLADLLGRSEDPLKLWVYQRILAVRNNMSASVPWEDWDRVLADQPLKQITHPDHPSQWNCGAALNQFGMSYFGSSHYQSGATRYYKLFRPKPNTPNKISDIDFDASLLSGGVDKIRQLLEKKTAVTLFVVHHDGFSVKNGIIQPSGKTHYLTIFGCDADGKNFLVTDPWPGGSRLRYESGILGTVDSAFMGKLRYDSNANVLMTPVIAFSSAAHNYTVLTGP